jgi:outer membrane protein assembly factor BamB
MNHRGNRSVATGHWPLATLLVLAVLTVSAGAADWFHWRGPWQAGVSPEIGLPAKWSPNPNEPGSNLIWKAPYGCRSTPIVMNGRVFIINGVGHKVTQQERVMCLDANTGKVLWQRMFNVFHTDIVSVRLGWASLAGDPKTGNIYGHSTAGLFFGYDKDGKLLWQHSLIEEYGRFTGYGGRVTTPTVDGNLVIVGMINSSWGDQKGGNRWLAVDKMTGVPVYWADSGLPPKDSFYAVPAVGVINGERLLVCGGADGSVVAFKVNTGEKVWSYPLSITALNSSPVLSGNHVFIGHGLESPGTNLQGKVVCLDAGKIKDGKPAVVWEREEIKARYASPIFHEDLLYVPDEVGRLHCLDAKTGATRWKYLYGRGARGSPVLADGKIYVGEVASRFYILKPGDKRCQKLHEHFFPSPDGTTAVEINGSPAVANGRVYFSTSEEIYCIGLKDAKSAPEPKTEIKEAPVPADAKAAHLQIIPADAIVYPGKTVSFKLRAFDDKGRFLREVKGENWSLPEPPPSPTGKIGPPLKGSIEAGTLTVAKNIPSQQGYVLAKAEGLTAKARVRVPPRPPYREDFEKLPNGAVPGGWVNAQGKLLVTTMKDGNKVLKKVNNKASPLFARGIAFLGMPDLGDYTIQADVMGTKVNDNLPEMGIVANRYSLVLAGNVQKLRILSWDALPRVEETINWPWQPKVWYTMKLTVTVKGNKGLIRGKVWPAGEKEPEKWSIEFTDPRPDATGSPGLYGYVTGIVEEQPGTDIFYDNVSVMPNKE